LGCENSVCEGLATFKSDVFFHRLLYWAIDCDSLSTQATRSMARYAEFGTRSRQEKIEADLRAAWQSDPVITAARSNRATHRRVHRPN